MACGCDILEMEVTMRLLLLFLVTASISDASQAANWAHLADCGSAAARRTYWYDPQSVASRGPATVVRIRADYSQVPGSPVANVRMTWSANCKTATFSELRRIEYRPDGKLLSSSKKPTRAAKAATGSVAAKLLDVVCRSEAR